MGIFSRMRDIIGSNLNAMLDRAEDPEKLIRLMIQEMEDTLVEVKASCAQAMAQAKRIQRELDFTVQKLNEWDGRAELALGKGREDLAREALREKRRWQERRERMETEANEQAGVVERYHDDIGQLEAKLASVREKQRLLVERHRQASQKLRAREDLRRADSSEVLLRFAQFESRVDRMEAQAGLAGPWRGASLDEQFDRLAGDEELERELAELKGRQAAGKTAAK